MNKSLQKLMVGSYFLTLALGVIVLVCLYLTETGRVSLSLPDGSIANHPWYGGDTMTYVKPAESFLAKGVFERNGLPDMHRTIGYPFMLSGLMALFGKHWVLAVYFTQLVVGALIFPAIIYILDSLGACRRRNAIFATAFLLISGVYLAYVGLILTDQFFTSLLYAGIACGFYAIRQKSWLAALLHVIIIGYAAQVRPTLGLFFLADFFFLVHIGYVDKAALVGSQKKMIFFMVFFALLAGNAAAARNYYNHGIFTPTTVLANNLARYLAGPVMIAEGQSEKYEQKLKEIKTLAGKEKIDVQEEFAFSTYQEYPISTIFRLAYHGVWNIFEPHWEYILQVYDSGFALNSFYGPDGKLQKSLFFNIPFVVLYCSLYLLFFLALIEKLKEKKYFLLLGVFIFLMPFFASFINGQGARMRLFAEPFIVVVSVQYLFAQGAEYISSKTSNI